MDEDHLKNLAVQLLQCERELFLLRANYEQAVSGLKLAQSLPQVIDRALPLPELCTKLVRVLTVGLRVQRAAFFVRAPDGLGPLSIRGDQSPRPLSEQARSLIAMTPSGLCNEPSEPALQDLANAVGLHRFLWTSIARAHSAPLLLVAGFDLERAAFQKALDDAQVAQIASIGQHLQALLANALLLNELELEKNLLQEFNDTLEQRVSKRTLELEQALARLREKDARIEEDLRQARSFQCGILPVITHWPCVEVEAHYHPLHVVGGDIYDVCEMAPHRYRVFIADATGHGIQASLRTIVLKGEYDRVKHAHLTPDRLLEALNAQLTRAHAPGEMLCTAVCFDIDLSAPEAPKLLCTSAAHPPLLVLSCGVIRTLASEGSFLGLEGATFGVVEATLEAGAVVIAYSDGLSDQLGPTNHEFDLQGALRTAGCDVAHTSLAELVRRLLEAFDTFRASVPVSDDVTLVAARISTLRGASNPGGSLENP